MGMQSNDYEIKVSKVHGKGLFARRRLKIGTVLGRCETQPAEAIGLYTLCLDEKQLNVICDLKYINHSKQANAVYWDDLTVEVIKPIKKGQEIFHDYGDEWD